MCCDNNIQLLSKKKCYYKEGKLKYFMRQGDSNVWNMDDDLIDNHDFESGDR